MEKKIRKRKLYEWWRVKVYIEKKGESKEKIQVIMEKKGTWREKKHERTEDNGEENKKACMMGMKVCTVKRGKKREATRYNKAERNSH